MSLITLRQASDVEKQNSQEWELWESGETSSFEYTYDKDVCFIVQSGEAVIHSPTESSVSIYPGCHVTIHQGIEGRWDIRIPVVNRYKYL